MLLFMLEEKITSKLYKTITQVDKEVLIQQCLAFSLRLLELSFIYKLGVSPSLVSRWREAYSFWGNLRTLSLKFQKARTIIGRLS